jgi:hypothetical protein
MSMSEVNKRAAKLAGHVECYLARRGLTQCSMTDATEAIWGTSGRGNPNAVKLIEAAYYLGYLRIQKIGARRRVVSRTDKVIPEEAFTAQDRKFAMEM